MTDLETILNTLADANIRFVVVGGVAVVLQGYPRLTVDLDLVVALDETNALEAIRTLEQLGYGPRAPVPLVDFASAAKRREWIESKNMEVFSLWSPRFPGTEVDLFVAEPLPYGDLERRASKVTLGAGQVPVASLEDSITMKERAGRPKDLLDIDVLRKIQAAQGRTDD